MTGIHFYIYISVGEDVLERLDKGLSDFGIVFTPIDDSKHNSIKISLKDKCGILMRCNSQLAAKECIVPSDIVKLLLILSQ